MKKFKFYAILLALVTFVACSDDFEGQIITDLKTDALVFTYEGGDQTFALESNEEWSVGELPNWITVEVVDAPDTRTTSNTYEKGKKSITVTVEENTNEKGRSAELLMISVSEKIVKLTITQKERTELLGYWILSEGTTGLFNSEMAWFDAATGVLEKKKFKKLNGRDLGDTGNALKVYGSKIYALVSGPGFGADTAEGTSYVEVINPKDGVSIKRIYFTNAAGVAAKPRSIIFDGGNAYISSYSNEVVRLDTLTLTLDKHAALSGTYAEGLTYSNDNLYVCNGGQGKDDKISVVDAKKMEEIDVITTVKNTSKIVSVSNGDIYFSTDWPEYKLYKLTVADKKIVEMPGLSVADITYSKSENNIYTSYFNWESYMGELYQFNTTTDTASKFNLELESPEYHIGTINSSNLLYLTGQMGDDVVIFDATTKEIKHAFKTGVDGGSGVVAVYK